MAQRKRPADSGATTAADGGDAKASASAARLFDVRRMIGGLFVAYGLIVTGAGIFDGQSAKDKAQGIDINLWAGLGMLALGVFFLAWLWLSPAEPPSSDDQEVMEAASRRAKH